MDTQIMNALQYGSTITGIDFKKANEHLSMFADDRRYKIIPLAASIAWAYNSTGIVKYKNIKYYYAQIGSEKIKIERM